MLSMWQRSNQVVWEELNGEALLIDPARKSAWVLNASATHIWKYCEIFGIEGIVSGLARSNSESMGQIAQEVRAFFDDMRARGLVEVVPAPVTRQTDGATAAFEGWYLTPNCQMKSLGAGPRKRPSPRGNSSPG